MHKYERVILNSDIEAPSDPCAGTWTVTTVYPPKPPCCGKCFPVVYIGIIGTCAMALSFVTINMGSTVRGDLDGSAYATIAASLLGAIGLTGYWIIFFAKPDGEPTKAGWYIRYQRSFVLPDGFLAVTSFALAANIAARSTFALNLGLVVSGGFFFLGNVDIWFDITNNLYPLICKGDKGQKTSMIMELVINIFSIGMGLWLNYYFAFGKPFGNHH